MNALESVGQRTFASISRMMYGLGYFQTILTRSWEAIGSRRSRRVLTFQILFTGIEALPITAILALGLGAVIIIQGVTLLPQFGQGQLVYPILITIIMRELGPILTAFIVAARSGTAIATELGNMVVSHEIEAYVSAGIDPISYLAVPRVAGVTISLILLNVYFSALGLLGSFFVTALITPIVWSDYLQGLFAAMSILDVIFSVAKSAVAGFVIGTVATYFGFAVQQASTEVPVMTIRSVGRGFVLVIITNGILTALYYLVV